MTPFPIPLTTPPETTMYFVILTVANAGAREREEKTLTALFSLPNFAPSQTRSAHVRRHASAPYARCHAPHRSSESRSCRFPFFCERRSDTDEIVELTIQSSQS